MTLARHLNRSHETASPAAKLYRKSKQSGKVLILSGKPPLWKPKEALRVRFGRRLHDLRVSRGVTQMQLAMRTGLDRSFLSDLERGAKEPSLGTVEVLANEFNISMSDLIKGL